DPLVGEVREEQSVAIDDERAAAVLVDARSHVEPVGRHLLHGAGGIAPHDDVSPSFRGPSLEPIDGVAVPDWRRQAQPLRRGDLRGDGRWPGPEWARGAHVWTRT